MTEKDIEIQDLKKELQSYKNLISETLVGDMVWAILAVPSYGFGEKYILSQEKMRIPMIPHLGISVFKEKVVEKALEIFRERDPIGGGEQNGRGRRVMKYKEFVEYCNERACDGLWSMQTAIACIEIMKEVNKQPFWKREKYWRENFSVEERKVTEHE